MIILHIAYLDSFYLWAEQTPAAGQCVVQQKKNLADSTGHSPNAPSSIKGRFVTGRRNTRSVSKEPQYSLVRDPGEEGWAKKIAPILSILGLFPSSLAERQVRKRLGSHQVWLPSRDGQALASSPLVEEHGSNSYRSLGFRLKGQGALSSNFNSQSAQADNVELLPWRVSSLRLSGYETVELLQACQERSPLAAGVVAGPGLAYMDYVLRFAERLVMTGAFLPGLVREHSTHLARWQPVPDVADEDYLRILAAYLPPMLSSLTPRPVSHPPMFSPAATVRELCEELLDAMVRKTIGADKNTELYKPRRHDTPHHIWLKGLFSSDGLIKSDLGSLPLDLERWRAPVDRRLASPIRIVFKIEDPQEGQDKWTLRFLVQPKEDPSLLLKAEEIWNQDRRLRLKDSALIREHLIIGLGRAAGISPVMAASLKGSNPCRAELTTDEAYEFLTQYSFSLKAAGFGVQVPVWWSKGGLDRRLSLKASVPDFSQAMDVKGGKKSELNLNTLIRVNWEMALGDETLDFKELEALATLKAPLVQVRGQWVELRPEDVQKAKAFWKHRQGAPDELPLRDVVNLALGAEVNISGLEASGLLVSGITLPSDLTLGKKGDGKAPSPIAELLLRLGGDASAMNLELAPPPELKAELRPYQRRGYAWLDFLTQWGLGACLADDMGLGKTVQTLAVLLRQFNKKPDRPFLLVCPTSVLGNWKRETERFTPTLPLMLHHGPQRAKGKDLAKAIAGKALILTSYGLLARDIASLSEINWAGIVLDEAQQVKNPDTAVAKAARALKGDARIALTGTPVENHVGDLWAIMDFLNPGLLGTRQTFKQKFLLPIQGRRDNQAAEQLRRQTSPFVLRRVKTDRAVIADLPDKVEMAAWCSLTKEQAGLYQAVLAELEKRLENSEGIARKGVVLASLTKLKQICDHPALFLADQSALAGRSGKLAMLDTLCGEIIENNEAALIFTQFARMGRLLQGYLQETLGREVLFLHGGTPMRARDSMVERFQQSGGPPIFVLSLKAGGTGLNLTRASHVIHYDRWWNPAVENQATDRAFRIGQDKSVQVRKLICAGTLEERVHELIESKKQMAENIVAVGETWITELSGQDLSRVLALDMSSVEDEE